MVNKLGEIECDCGRQMSLNPLSYFSKEELIEVLEKGKGLKHSRHPNGITRQELIAVLKMRIKPVEVKCLHCHKLHNIEKIIPAIITVEPYMGSGSPTNVFGGLGISFNG